MAPVNEERGEGTPRQRDLASGTMTVVYNFKKVLEATIHMEDRRREIKVTVQQKRNVGTIFEQFPTDSFKPSKIPTELSF